MREIFEKNNIPASIQQVGGGYKLIPLVGLKIRLSVNFGYKSSEIKLSHLREKFKADFSAKEVSDLLKVSLKTVQRMLNSAQESGELERYKVKTAVKYRWISK